MWVHVVESSGESLDFRAARSLARPSGSTFATIVWPLVIAVCARLHVEPLLQLRMTSCPEAWTVLPLVSAPSGQLLWRCKAHELVVGQLGELASCELKEKKGTLNSCPIGDLAKKASRY